MPRASEAQLAILFGIALAAIVGTAPPAHAGLVTHYAFDESGTTTTAADSANSNDGLLTGFDFDADSGWDPAGGQFGGAVHLDGTDDFVSDTDFVRPAAAFTYSFWFKPDTTWTVGSDRADLIYPVTGTGPIFLFLNTNGKVRASVNGFSGTNHVFESTATSWSSSTWHHVALTFDGSDYRYYIDGVQDGATVNDPGDSQAGTGYVIGRTHNFPRFSDVSLDDFSIWDAGLSSTDMATLQVSGVAGLLASSEAPEPGAAGLVALVLASTSVCGRRGGRPRQSA